MTVEEGFVRFREEIKRALVSFSRDPAAAEDAVQQAFVQALLRRDQLCDMPEQALKAWLSATARNALLDAKRRTSRWAYVQDFQEAMPNLTVPFEDWTDRMLVETLLARLPASLRQVVRLRYITGLNATQIGVRLGIPTATVRTWLRKALKDMKAYERGK